VIENEQGVEGGHEEKKEVDKVKVKTQLIKKKTSEQTTPKLVEVSKGDNKEATKSTKNIRQNKL